MRSVGIFLLSLTPVLFSVDYLFTYKKRVDFLNIFEEFICFVKEQIRFCSREKDEIFALATKDPRFRAPLFEKFTTAIEDENTLAKIFKNSIDIRLNKKEQELCFSFLWNLGKSDTEGQITHCDFYKLQFEKICESENVLYKTKIRLWLSLSSALSAVIFILMI